MSIDTAAERRAPRRQAPRALWHRWSRSLHSWTSMTSLVLVLFFSVTGLTLNHPDWVGAAATQRVEGTLPAAALAGGQVDFLAVSEFLRETHAVTGSVTDHGTKGDQGRLAYTGPGYDASVLFSVSDGTFTLTQTRYGLLGVLNDLHKGRNTSPLWSVVIDASAIVLVLVSLTGLVLQLLIERRRRTALILLGIGSVAGLALLWISG